MKKRIVKIVRDEKPFLRIGASLLKELGFLAPGTKLSMTIRQGKLIIVPDDTVEEPVKKDEVDTITSKPAKKTPKIKIDTAVKIAKDVKESFNKLLKSSF